MDNKVELEQLKTQIAQLEKHFHKEITYLRERVIALEMQLQAEEKAVEMPVKEEVIAPITYEEKVPTLQEILFKFQEKEREKVKFVGENIRRKAGKSAGAK